MFESFSDIVSVEDIAAMLHIGKSSAYTLLQSDQIQHVRIGRKYIVPKQSVVGFLSHPCYNNDQIIGADSTTVTLGGQL